MRLQSSFSFRFLYTFIILSYRIISFIYHTYIIAQWSYLHIPACSEAGVGVQGRPGYSSNGAKRIKGLAQGPNTGSLAVLKLEPPTYWSVSQSLSYWALCSRVYFWSVMPNCHEEGQRNSGVLPPYETTTISQCRTDKWHLLHLYIPCLQAAEDAISLSSGRRIFV